MEIEFSNKCASFISLLNEPTIVGFELWAYTRAPPQTPGLRPAINGSFPFVWLRGGASLSVT